jgi:4-diphosphocytidyl-2-C-methyl-D-erythritol kinase
LRVHEPRADGFHDIETLFQELDLGDDLFFRSRPESVGCNIKGFPEDVVPETNLITRAWELMRRGFPDIGGLNVEAVKRIPRGGGLGGGSSNAAATLGAINELYKLNLPTNQLEKLGAQLGSDVPFFVQGGIATGHGRGEQLVHLEDGPAYHLVLVFPTEGVSTREAYARLDHIPHRPAPRASLDDVIEVFQAGDPHALAQVIHNDFELAVADESWFKQTTLALDGSGSLRTFLCGSGSTIAGLAADLNHSLEMHNRVCNILPYSCCTVCTLTGTRTHLGPVDFRRTS